MAWQELRRWVGYIKSIYPFGNITDCIQNNWNSLGCDVSESLLLDTSQKLVHSGLRDVGYNYVVLDDCWSDGRDENGFLKVDLKKFPSGMNYVSDQIHSQGLLYGMYSSAGEMTCARYGRKRICITLEIPCLRLTTSSWFIGLRGE
jgi:hypothetical protein